MDYILLSHYNSTYEQMIAIINDWNYIEKKIYLHLLIWENNTTDKEPEYVIIQTYVSVVYYKLLSIF